MSEIEFTDPPQSSRERHQEIADTLRARPGEWALIVPGAPHSSLVTRIRRGKGAFHPEGSFEAKSRYDGTGEFVAYDIYARFIGESK